MKTAILQVADSGPLESLVVMLTCAGYRCCLPSTRLKDKLRAIGCDTVLDVQGLVENWGYDWPIELPIAGEADMSAAALYVDVKAHRNGPKVWKQWPWLRNRTLWYRINGGEPEITPQGGDEVHLPCPILTPNQYYETGDWGQPTYVTWPPFYRFHDWPKRRAINGPPLCLIHNVAGWGYGALLPIVEKLGVQCYGAGSPNGLIQHKDLPDLLSWAVAMVHLKSNDCPGYAIYEALASACPIIATRRMIWRMKMEGLLIPNETCLVFDRIGHQGLTEQDLRDCEAEIKDALEQLSDSSENRRIGEAGHNRLLDIMWRQERDGPSFIDFMNRAFP